MISLDKKELVRQTYNQVAHLYNLDRLAFTTHKYLKIFLSLLAKQAHILDLGCGNGVPIDQILLKQGYLVTGIDFSKTQIDLARKNCPQGEFILADLEELKSKQFQVDGVICLYTLFHLPRVKHLQILKIISSFLPHEAPILISMGDKDFEGVHEFYKEKMWSSHYAPNKNLQIVQNAGFKIIINEIDKSAHEKHQIIIAKKN